MSQVVGAGTDPLAGVLREPLGRVAGEVVAASGFSGGLRLASRREEEVAAALRDHFAEFDAFVRSGAKGGPPSVSGLTARDVDFLRSGDFLQIWGDYRHLMGDGQKGPVTPTLRFTLEHSGVGPDSRVLEIGGSTGRHLLHLAERRPRLLANLDYHLMPLVLGSSAWAARGIGQPMLWVWGDALTLPFSEGAFTHVNTFVTISLLPVCEVLREIRRVLAPGGRVTLTVEGIAYWRRHWRETRGLGRARLGRIREWVAYRLMRHGVNWQSWPLLRGRLAGHTAFDGATIARLVRGEGFEVERWEVLTEEEGSPRLIALTATKRPDPA